MKKLVFVLPTFNPGGAENVLIRLANYFCRFYEVHLLVVMSGGVLQKTVSEKITVHDLDCARVRHAFTPLRSTLKGIRPDIVFSTITRLNILLLLVNETLWFKYKLILRQVNIPSKSTDSQALAYVYKIIYRWLYPRAKRIVCQSDFMLKEMQLEFGVKKHKLLLIYNPVSEKYLRQPRDIPPNPFRRSIRFLSIGRLEEQKGYDILIEAFALIHREYPESELVILGQGHLQYALQDQIQNLGLSQSVRLEGFKENVLPYVYHAHAVVSSSHYEGLPNALIESITMGTPVLATACPGGTREVVKDGRNGYLIETVTAGDIAAGLIKMIEQPLTHDRQSVRETAKLFHPDNIYRQYRTLFDSLV